MKLLDLFCGAGAAAAGYADAGFEVIGVDKYHQPNYPYEFHQADAMEVAASRVLIDWLGIDVIHASPPCQSYSYRVMALAYPQPKLIEPLRELLLKLGRPYVIENVVDAPLIPEKSIMLCGTMFGLNFYRHRLFECGGCEVVEAPFACDHSKGALKMFGHGDQKKWMDQVFEGKPWMSQKAATQAVPPVYTEYIGLQLKMALGVTRR
jgi:DNA (cytosine-5)-methyltransferase 1